MLIRLNFPALLSYLPHRPDASPPHLTEEIDLPTFTFNLIFYIYFSYFFSQVLLTLLHRKDSRISAPQPTLECLLYAMDPKLHLQLENLLQPTRTQLEEGTGVAPIDTDLDCHLHSCFFKPASNYHVLIRFSNLHSKLLLPACFSATMLYFITIFVIKLLFLFYIQTYI